MTHKYGIQGAKAIGENKLLLYVSELPGEYGRTKEEIIDDFDTKAKKLTDDNSERVDSVDEGGTRIKRYSRDGSTKGATSYEQAISNLHPKKETRQRIAGTHKESKVGDWASRILSGAQQMHIFIL